MPGVERILLVDDDDDFILLLKTAFDLAEFRGNIQAAANSAQAIEYLRSAAHDRLPQLVVTDLRLHRDSGFELLDWIRRRPELNHLVVKVLSGVKVDKEERRAYELGADEYLIKPLEFSQLVRLAEQLSGQRAAERWPSEEADRAAVYLTESLREAA